jgi:hypothetical protein
VTPEAFYREIVPARWNDRLERAFADAQSGAELRIDTTVRVVVGQPEGETFFLNIRDGRIATEDRPQGEISIDVSQDRRGFERIAADSDGDPLRFLGLLAGSGEPLRLTKTRLRALQSLDGALELRVTGDSGFRIGLCFGSPRVGRRATVTMTPAVYEAMRDGALDLQRAFLDGQLELSGDLDLAMRVALAAFSPDGA